MRDILLHPLESENLVVNGEISGCQGIVPVKEAKWTDAVVHTDDNDITSMGNPTTVVGNLVYGAGLESFK